MKKFKAFSIIEAALFLAIIGIAVSLIIPIWKAIEISTKLKKNEEKYEYIRHAMQSFLIQHGHLPNAGDENGIAIKEQYVGIVPYKTLGINKKYTKNSKNKNFTYAVNKHLCKKENKKYIPITMPLSITVEENNITFCRYYEFQDGKLINYDLLCDEPGLILLEKGVSIIDEEDYIHIMHQTSGKFKTSEELGFWIRSSIETTLSKFKAQAQMHKNCNQVAWILISHGPQTANDSKSKLMNKTDNETFCITPDIEDVGVFNDQVFYQTRFDMAAQINFPCSVEPIINTINEKI